MGIFLSSELFHSFTVSQWFLGGRGEGVGLRGTLGMRDGLDRVALLGHGELSRIS